MDWWYWVLIICGWYFGAAGVIRAVNLRSKQKWGQNEALAMWLLSPLLVPAFVIVTVVLFPLGVMAYWLAGGKE